VLETIAAAATSQGDLQLEHRIIRRGETAWVELRGKVFVDAQQQPTRMAGVCMDITDRKRTEADLAEYRVRLEELVEQRTAELQASHEKLRLSDRLASIGTLAAGLGHDMGNLLLPIRARLASLESMNLPPAAQQDIDAVKNAGDYLKRLSQGLRLFALDPGEQREGESTHLSAWWLDVSPFLRNILPKQVMFDASIPENVPAINIPPHTFTQVVYNLFQNAGDAMRPRERGNVQLRVVGDQASEVVLVEVSDDGPGMTEEVQRRCLEPFYTTRTRRISTGLGLALVHGAVTNAGGSVEVQSQVGKGTTFRLHIPRAAFVNRLRPSAGKTPMACVAVADRRLSAYVTSLIRGLGMELYAEKWSADMPAELLVLDSVNGCAEEFERFLGERPTHRAIILHGETVPNKAKQTVFLGGQATPGRIRQALQQMLQEQSPITQEAIHS